MPGHPRLSFHRKKRKTWMPGTRPGMTEQALRQRHSLVETDQFAGIDRAEIADAAVAQECVERRLDSFLRLLRATIAHPGVLIFGMHDVDAVSLGLSGRRQHAGIGLEVRSLGTER